MQPDNRISSGTAVKCLIYTCVMEKELTHVKIYKIQHHLYTKNLHEEYKIRCPLAYSAEALIETVVALYYDLKSIFQLIL